VQKIHKKLNNERLEEAKIKKYLQELDRIQITLDVLKVRSQVFHNLLNMTLL